MNRELSYYKHIAESIDELKTIPEEEREAYCNNHGISDYLFADVIWRTRLSYLERRAEQAERIDERYKGMSIYEYEKWKKQRFNEILQTEDPFERVSAFEEASLQIKEAIERIGLLKAQRFHARLGMAIEMCWNMLKSGKYTLTDISDILPDMDLYELYQLAKKNWPDKVRLTEEEKQILKKEYPEMELDSLK